ncbi:MAG: leucine zipper domain-containing protein [bacterium]
MAPGAAGDHGGGSGAEVWLALLKDDARALRAYDPGRSRTLEGYVGLIADRVLVDRLRAATAEKRGFGTTTADDAALGRTPAADGGPDQVVESAELAAALGDHLRATLPGTGLLVFRLVFTDELAPVEAARAMGVNLQVVYNWQHRIRQEARDFLARQAG